MRESDDVWKGRLAEASEAAGEGLDPTSPNVMHYRDLRLLCEPANGEPCEWGEVVDAIRLEAAKASRRAKPIRSWLWVKDTALSLRDRRLQGLPPPAEVVSIRGQRAAAKPVVLDEAEQAARLQLLQRLNA